MSNMPPQNPQAPQSPPVAKPQPNPQIAWDAWKYDQDVMRQEARRAHDEHQSYGLENFKATIAFGVEAIRTSALINGGALVASLALVGATSQSRSELASKLIEAVPAFAVGVLSAGAASSFAYLAQYAFATSHNSVQRTWKHPYIEVKRSSQVWEWLGTICQLVAIGAVIVSYASVVYGANAIYQAWPH